LDTKSATQKAIEYLQTGRLEQAEEIFMDILKIDPHNISVLHFIGIVHYKLKKYASSLDYINRALQFGPDYVDAYNNMGIVLQELGRFDEAVACYKKALELRPDFGRAHYNLGTVLKEQYLIDEAVVHYQKALSIDPNFVEAYNNLGLALQDQGKIEEAEVSYRRALSMRPDFTLCYSNLLFLMNHNPRYDAQFLFSEHLRFAKQIAEPVYPASFHYANDRAPSRRLRIGYVSPDFRRHAVAYFAEPVIISHNHKDFEVFCYSNSVNHDEVTQRIIDNADRWHNIAEMSDHRVAELIRADCIDLLVDLAGHTANNRILVFAQRPAPIQISWIGYLATTGLSAMDYRIADIHTDPPGMNERLYTEELVRLADIFLCYLPDKDSPDVGMLPSVTAGFVTFGSFNKLTKISEEVITVWSNILKAIPNSRLLLKTFGFRDPGTRRYAAERFVQKGIAAERIIMQNSDPSPWHLKSYNDVDIGLDTFPFNGAATTCEAMWMGVPVISLAGTAYHSRIGASLLSNNHLSEFVARTYDEYVEIAVNLANNTERLEAIRCNLRNVMSNSPLTNAKKLTLNLENCYRSMWQKWCNTG
jgi:protein O-GlcNAc transferase